MKTKEQLQQALEEAKERFPVGTPVHYYPIMGEETRVAEWVRHEPWILSGHTVVLKISNQTGCVDVDHLQVREVDPFPAAEPQRVRDEACLIEQLQQLGEEYGCPGGLNRFAWLRQRLTKLTVLEAASVESDEARDMGEVSDGYHTFNELYAHRVRLFVGLMHAHRNRAWWSHNHQDPADNIEGWIIAGIRTPAGEATYHLPASEIEHLPNDIQIGFAPRWDGHTADDVLQRLLSLNFGQTDGSSIEHLPLPPKLVYQYSASINSARGTVLTDGVIELESLINGIDDYRAARALIAADLGVTDMPGAVNVHSLSIVGGDL